MNNKFNINIIRCINTCCRIAGTIADDSTKKNTEKKYQAKAPATMPFGTEVFDNKPHYYETITCNILPFCFPDAELNGAKPINK